jgi:hypothetical protein
MSLVSQAAAAALAQMLEASYIISGCQANINSSSKRREQSGSELHL